MASTLASQARPSPHWSRDDLVAALVVDHDPESLTALQSLLEPLCDLVVGASSGEEALAHLRAREFALILLDADLPGIDVFETSAKINGGPERCPVPIIVLTRHDSAHEARRSYGAGAVDYLPRPVEAVALLSKVWLFIELARAREELRAQRSRLARKTERIENFYRFGRLLAAETDVDALATVIVTQLCDLVGSPAGALYACEQGTPLVRVASLDSNGRYPARFEVPDTAIPCLLGTTIQTELQIPFVRAGHLRGLFVAAVPAGQRVPPNDLSALDHLAGQAAIALAHAQELRCAQRPAARTEVGAFTTFWCELPTTGSPALSPSHQGA